MKDVINQGGYKVYSIEVEGAIVQHASVVEWAVVGFPDDVLGQKVHAFVLTRDAFDDVEALRSHCVGWIADYKLPDRIIFLSTPLPRNAAGKVLKNALRNEAAACGL